MSEALQWGAERSTKNVCFDTVSFGLSCSLGSRNLANPLRIRIVVVIMLQLTQILILSVIQRGAL